MVEGISDKKLIESAIFKDWAKQECGLEILDEVVDAGGNRNMCSHKIEIYIDLVVIARKAMESWFLADTEAMRKWLGDENFQLANPEETDEMPWDYIKKLGKNSPKQRGPGSKIAFARKFIRDYGFDVCRAAKHPNCPSSKYFIMKLYELGK